MNPGVSTPGFFFKIILKNVLQFQILLLLLTYQRRGGAANQRTLFSN
jgi:hypothetical protein